MAEFGWDLPEDLAAAKAYVEREVAEARTRAERDVLDVYRVTPEALHRVLHPCNCVVVWSPVEETHVWLSGTIDGACGHPPTGTRFTHPVQPPRGLPQ